MENLIKVLALIFIPTMFIGCLGDDDSVVACACPEIYQPVCSDGGTEFLNSCEADCAGAIYTEGFCERTSDAFIRDLGDIASDGCGWVIEIEDTNGITNYRGDVLEESFKVDGLKVRVTYKPTFDTSPCGFSETVPVINVISMSEL